MGIGRVIIEFFNPDEPITDENPNGEIKILYTQDLNQAHAERVLNNSRGARLKEGQGFVFKEGTLVVVAKPTSNRRANRNTSQEEKPKEESESEKKE